MASILNIKGLEILDSRGNPTLEIEVTLDDGSQGISSVPSGASTGKHEAFEKRDNDPTRYHGKGVLSCIRSIETEILHNMIGLDAFDQRLIDQTLIHLDNSENKSNLGANTTLGVSLAVAYAAANAQEKPLYSYLGGALSNLLPIPFMNLLNGGAHADNALSVQEFMIVPHGAQTFKQAVQWGSEIYHTLKLLLKRKGLSVNVGDEGGFAPNIASAQEALDILTLAIEESGRQPGSDVSIALDVAATEVYRDNLYYLEGKTFSSTDLTIFYEKLVSNYPIISIEDGMSEDDWHGWQELTKRLSSKIQLVGDDLFVTNQDRVLEGQEKEAANAILIKPNQIGTLTETRDVIQLAQDLSMGTIISHRSGETEDTSIADLSVAFGCGQIKTGAPCRVDRTAKYNRLLRIEDQLGSSAVYPFYK